MDFGAMFQTWVNVLTHPNEQTFADEQNKPQATLITAIIWIVIAAVIVSIFSIFRVLVSTAMISPTLLQELALQFDMPPEFAEQFALQAQAGLVSSIISAFCWTLIAVPLGFLIGSGIYWIVAKILGGSGSFESQTYLIATYSAPLMIVSGIIGVIPILGACVGFILGIYNLVLTYFALKVSHNFTTGKAITTLLVPILIGILIACCVAFAIMMFVGALLEGVEGGGF